MKDIVIEYDVYEDQKIWEAFVVFFREVKGYNDWTCEEIATSMNKDDVEEFINYIRKVLGE